MYNRNPKDWISFFSYLFFLPSPPVAQRSLRSGVSSLSAEYSPDQLLLEDAELGAEGVPGSTDSPGMTLGQECLRRTVLTQ